MKFRFRIFTSFGLLFVAGLLFIACRAGGGNSDKAEDVNLTQVLKPSLAENKSTHQQREDCNLGAASDQGASQSSNVEKFHSLRSREEASDSKMAQALTDIEVPQNYSIPATLMDAGAPDDSQETKAMMKSIMDDFANSIQVAKNSGQKEVEAWEEARQKADERYRLLFGEDAFKEASLAAAIDAIEENNPARSPIIAE